MIVDSDRQEIILDDKSKVSLYTPEGFRALSDLWLKVGFRLFYIEILFNTKDWVLYEYMVDGKPKSRKDFVKMDKDYGK